MKLAAVFAHPDDDTYAVGGTVALHAGRGLDLLVVLATSGEAGPIAHPALATRSTLGAVREGEAAASYEALGIPGLIPSFLRYPDGRLADVPHEELAGRLVGILSAFEPDVVVTFGPDGITGHADHVAIHRAATEAFHRAREGRPSRGFARLLYTALPESTIERWREIQRQAGVEPFNPDDPYQPRGVPDGEVAVRVDCAAVVARKLDALRAHRTQAEELEAIPEEALPVVFAHEFFVQGWPEPAAGGPVLSDVFESLED